jgi:serine/threonine protein kinase
MTQASLIGQTLNRQYRITRKLGEGGFGAVYEAEEARFKRRVAIKTIHPQLLQDPTALERFRREGLAASRLDHPAAVKVFNLLESEDGLVFMVMEFIEGKTLSETIKERGSLTIQETQLLLQPICEVLHEAHQKGIVHRDLKPKNIMLTPTPGGFFAKVLDFGISLIASEKELSQTSASLGTPAYMAPEQWQTKSLSSPQTDIYALGLIVYRCLSGKLPFDGSSSTEWMKHHCSTIPTPLSQMAPHIPSALSSVVAKALSKEPNARQATPMEFYQDYCNTLQVTIADPSQAVDTGDTVFDPRLPPLVVKPENLSLPTLLRGDAEEPALLHALQKNTEEEGEKLAKKLLAQQNAPTQPVRRMPEASSGLQQYLTKQNLMIAGVFFVFLLLAYLLGRMS